MSINPVGPTSETQSLNGGLPDPLQPDAAAGAKASPTMPSDRIAQHSPSPGSLDDYRSAIAGAAAATWGAAQRASTELPQLGEVATKFGSAAFGTAGKLAGPIGIVATTQSSAGNVGEDAPDAAWRASSRAASDRAPMVLHPIEAQTNGKPIAPSAGIEHTGQTRPADRVSSTTSTPHIQVGGSTTTTPIHRAGGSTSITPAAHRPVASDAATLVVNAHDTARALPGWKVEPQSVTRTDGSKLRATFDKGERQAFVKDLAANHREELVKAGLSDARIDDMAKTGKPPRGFEVHHIVALSQGGTNAASNLVLLHAKPEHQSITGQQNSAMSGMRIGESRVIDILKPPADVKIYRTTEPAEVGK